jgi:hypothetical protein
MPSDALLVGLGPNSAAIPERPGRVGEDLDRRQDVVQHDGLRTTPLLFSWPYAFPASHSWFRGARFLPSREFDKGTNLQTATAIPNEYSVEKS